MSNDLLGLYLSLKQRRQQEEQFRAQQEARQQAQVMQGFQQALEFAKLGDPKLTQRALSMLTDDRDTFEMREIADTLSKQAKKAAAEAAATPDAAGRTRLAEGVAAQITPDMDPRQQAIAQLRAEEQMRLEGNPLAANIASEGAALFGAQERDLSLYGRRLDEQGKREWLTFYNRDTGKFAPPVRGNDMETQQRLADAGYFKVNSVGMQGTPKDFAGGVTPTTATHAQDRLMGLMESRERLRVLRDNFNPEFFKYQTAAKVFALEKLEKAGARLTPEQAKNVADFREYTRTIGEETLAYTVSMAASTFTDRLREHIETIRLSPDLAPSVAQRRIEELYKVGEQSIARINFALRNGIVAATDFVDGELTPEARERLEKEIPMNIPGFSQPSTNKRIDRLMENRADALLKEAALKQIPPSERKAWVMERMDEEFFSEPPIGQVLEDPVEADILSATQGTNILPPEERVPQLSVRRVR